MATARDQTIREVLTQKQLRLLSEPIWYEFLNKILIQEGHNANHVDFIINNIIENGEVPDSVALNQEQKTEINNFIAETTKKAEKDFKEALATLDPLNYHAITINTNGSNKKGVTDHRREMIRIILRNVVPAVVFCQELPGKFKKKVVNEVSTDWDYVRTKTKEAGVIWNKKHFVGCELSNTKMKQIKKKLIREGKPAANLLSRACFVKLTSVEVQEGESRSFIAVSYHGVRNKTKTKNRKEIFKCLIEFVQELCKKEVKKDEAGKEEADKEIAGIPFLIGGDFNFDTLDVDIENVACQRYEMTPRSSSPRKIPYKDNFYWDIKTPINMTSVRPFVFGNQEECDFGREERHVVDNHRDAERHGVEADKLLDHDPIIGIIELQDPIVANLETMFTGMSV